MIPELIYNQIVHLENIGINYLNIDPDYEYDFNLLKYMHENYIPIHGYDDILQNELKATLIFKYCYELYVLDMINEIIPYIKQIDDDDNLKTHLFNFIKMRIDNMNILSEVVNIDKSKYLFYLDLFDSDLTNFKENYLTKVYSKYYF